MKDRFHRRANLIAAGISLSLAGAFALSITVVPDSGTGQLAGLAGKMMIKITDGKHFYEFEYTLADTPVKSL